jgi:hypothetical protein
MLLTVILLTSLLTVSIDARNINDVLGDVLQSDVIAYINGYPMRTFAADGKILVIADDLRDYGFDVVWNDATRSVHIVSNINAINAPASIASGNQPPGSFVMHYIYSDIKVYLSGVLIESYVADGQVLIDFEPLKQISAPSQHTASISYDGDELTLIHPPVVHNGFLFFTVESLMAGFGGEYFFDESTRTVVCTFAGRELLIPHEDLSYTVNGRRINAESHELLFVESGRTYVSLDMMNAAFDLSLVWFRDATFRMDAPPPWPNEPVVRTAPPPGTQPISLPLPMGLVQHAGHNHTWNRLSYDGIEIAEGYIDDGKPKPLLIFIRTAVFSDDMSYHTIFPSRCAADLFVSEGFFVLQVGVPATGIENARPGPDLVMNLWYETVQNIDILIDYYRASGNPNVDAYNFAVCGFGSVISQIALLYAATGQYTPNMLILRNGNPDLLISTENRRVITNAEWRGDITFSPEMHERAVASSPINNIDRFLNIHIETRLDTNHHHTWRPHHLETLLGFFDDIIDAGGFPPVVTYGNWDSDAANVKRVMGVR